MENVMIDTCVFVYMKGYLLEFAKKMFFRANNVSFEESCINRFSKENFNKFMTEKQQLTEESMLSFVEKSSKDLKYFIRAEENILLSKVLTELKTNDSLKHELKKEINGDIKIKDELQHLVLDDIKMLDKNMPEKFEISGVSGLLKKSDLTLDQKVELYEIYYNDLKNKIATLDKIINNPVIQKNNPQKVEKTKKERQELIDFIKKVKLDKVFNPQNEGLKYYKAIEFDQNNYNSGLTLSCTRTANIAELIGKALDGELAIHVNPLVASEIVYGRTDNEKEALKNISNLLNIVFVTTNSKELQNKVEELCNKFLITIKEAEKAYGKKLSEDVSPMKTGGNERHQKPKTPKPETVEFFKSILLNENLINTENDYETYLKLLKTNKEAKALIKAVKDNMAMSSNDGKSKSVNKSGEISDPKVIAWSILMKMNLITANVKDLISNNEFGYDSRIRNYIKFISEMELGLSSAEKICLAYSLSEAFEKELNNSTEQLAVVDRNGDKKNLESYVGNQYFEYFSGVKEAN